MMKKLLACILTLNLLLFSISGFAANSMDVIENAPMAASETVITSDGQEQETEVEEQPESSKIENSEDIQSSITVYTASEELAGNKALYEMVTYGIIRGDENGDYHLDERVKRSEGAAIMNRLNRLDVSVGSPMSEDHFSDVSKDDWFYADVYWAEAFGIMQGYPDNTFRPNEFLDYEQFSKMLICVLGYSRMAEENGGYPFGYVDLAQRLGITKGVNLGAGFTREQMVKMLYHAFDVNLAISYASGSETTVDVSSRTLRNTFDANGGMWTKRVGIVTANYSTYLLAPLDGLKENEVQIDGLVYDAGNTDIAEHIGAEVEFYCYVDENDYFQIQSYRLTNKNEVINIDEQDISHIEEGRIIYFEDEKSIAVRYTPDTIFVKNGRVLLSGDAEDLNITDGFLRLRDNNGDGQVDIIFIYESQSLVVDRVSGNSIYWKGEKKFDGKSSLHFDENDEYLIYKIHNKDGKTFELTDIKSGEVLSVFASADKKVYELIVSDKIVEGTIEQISEDEIVIDGTAYLCAQDVLKELSLGNTVTAYLDYRDKVALVESETERILYGYANQVDADGALGDKVKVQMLIPSDFKEQEIINDDDEFNITITKKMVGKNAAVQNLELAEKVKVNEASRTTKEAMEYLRNPENKLVAYELNSDGKIRSLTKPILVMNEETGMQGDTQKYNANEKVFGGNATGVFGVDEKTKILCIPDDSGITCMDDYLAEVDINHNSQYKVKGYDLDEETKNAKVIVITMRLRADDPGVINSSSKLALCTEYKKVLGSEGTVQTEVSFLSEKKPMKYVLTEEYAERFSGIQKGDVFYYALNSSDKIDRIELVDSLLSIKGFYSDGVASADKTILGQIVEIDLNELSDTGVRRINIATLNITEDGSETDTVEIPQQSTPAIYVIRNGKNPNMKVGSFDDVEEGDILFAEYRNGKIDGIVVVKQ